MNEYHEAAIRTYGSFQKGMRVVKDLHQRASTDLDETSIKELQDLHVVMGSYHALLGVVLTLWMKGTACSAAATVEQTAGNSEIRATAEVREDAASTHDDASDLHR